MQGNLEQKCKFFNIRNEYRSDRIRRLYTLSVNEYRKDLE
jgi:hypothetical protein